MLAESWRNVDDFTWEFRLREGVRFHDGTPFEAEDVAFSFTREPTPFFDRDITAIMMLSRRIHANATLGDFNQGRALIGTGAYRHVSCTPQPGFPGQAMRAATDDPGVISVHDLRVIWAAQRARVRYDASPIWYTNALLASPAE